MCLEKREQSFVDYARQIVVYLAGTSAGSKVVEFLLLQITPKAMVQDKDKRQSFIAPQDTQSLPYLADLNAIFPGGPAGSKQQGLSLGQLSIILLVDLMVAPTELSKEFVPLLLQVVLVLWDHYIPLVQDQAREMLVHLIHELVISKIDDPNTSPTHRSIEDFIEMIRRRDTKVVWVYDDFNGKNEGESELRVPESMIYVSTQVVDIFSIAFPGIREEWGKIALKWASNCPVHHLACRSFQVFRSILSSLDQPMLADMLARLSNTIADDGSEVQTFSMEILTTLKTIMDAFAPEDLVQYPQLFWTTCACLDTIHEREFIESLSMLEKILQKMDLADPVTVQRLLDGKPPKWDGEFDGLISLVLKGARSSICLDRTLQVLEDLVVLPPNKLVGEDSGLVFTVLANVPRFLRWYEHDAKEPTASSAAEILAKVADARGYSDVSKALRGMINRLFRTDMEFLSGILSTIRAAFFPELEFKCLVFLMSLLTNKLPWFKVKTMQLLCKMIPDINMRKPEIASKGPDLISPLLRLLQTEFCPQALAVLDNVMTMNATPLDNKHIRMSMVGANSSRAARKEYERTQSLFGIPEDSGWSIPMPAIHSSTTRSNVHAVFYTCASPGITVATENETPNIELVEEEYNGSYFPDYRTATMMSDDTRGEGHVGDLQSKLESLDDFFDDDTPDSPPLPPPGHSLSRAGGSSVDVRETFYEQQTFPILRKSLTRNASVSSFQTGFSDMRISPSREAMIMTPGAFTAGLKRMQAMPPSQPLRPTLHARSATSPAANHNSPPGTAISIDEAVGDSAAFSDDDMSNGRPKGTDRMYSLDQDARPRQGGGLRSGWRSGIRRLTGGGGDSKDSARTRETIRAQMNKSPEVPKVPDMYLLNPRTSEF
jgi:hypothetical protein